MKLDFSVPITAYEFIAIALAALALIFPLIKLLYIKLFKRIKFSFLPTGLVTLYFNRSGSYISVGGVYESKNKSAIVKSIRARVVRDSDNSTLNLDWSTFSSPVYHNGASGIESTFETAHPFRVSEGMLEPAFVEFSDENYTDEKTAKILAPVESEMQYVINKPGIQLLEADHQVKQLQAFQKARIELNDLFFWRTGTYRLYLTTKYNESVLETCFCFDVSAEDSAKLRKNVDGILLIPVGEFFRAPVRMERIQKKLEEC